MALVLYQVGASNSAAPYGMATATPNFVDGDSGSNELEGIANALDNLTSKERKRKYIGLANQGATCYLNSLMQSLYMTAEFREFIY